jgi:hypothetical protein
MKIAQFIARIIFAGILLFILYLFALNGRYQYIENGPYAVDKWSNTVSEPVNWKEFSKGVSQENDTTFTETQSPEESETEDYE